MPTPESELFLAKKPKVPPTFAGVDFNDYQAVVDARDAIIRENWVKTMMARLVREELGMLENHDRRKHDRMEHGNHIDLARNC